MHENEPEFHRRIIMNDEVYFHLGGYVNKQNCRIWGSENPKEIIKKPLYPQRVTVWCDFWAGWGIIGPYFFEIEAGAAASVNKLRYWTMINKLSWPELEDMDVDNVHFQKDGATCYTSRETIGFCMKSFQAKWFLETMITIDHRDYAIKHL